MADKLPDNLDDLLDSIRNEKEEIKAPSSEEIDKKIRDYQLELRKKELAEKILKSISKEKETTKKSSAIVPAKFLGEDKYDKYYDELLNEGRLKGDNLSPQQRKEGVKAYKKGKIDFKTFVDKVLSAKKEQSVESSGGSKDIGAGGGALVLRKKTISADDIKSGSSVETEQNLDEILKGIDSIRETLKKEEDLKKKQASDSKRSEEKKKRKAKEEKLEGSVFKGLAKQTKKVFAPVKSILDRMIDFFTKILIGRFLVKLIDWMTDEKNQKKLEALGFLLEKTWPALITAFVLFGTAFGGLIRGILGLALKFTGKLLGAAAKFAIKNPLAAAAVAVVGGAAVGGIMQSQTQSNDPERAAQGKTQLDDTFEFGGATGDPMGALFGSGGGLTPKPKGTDTVPAMLTPGEFVMSKGAVDAFGTDFMESLNSLGGGTNKPKRSNGTLYASGGGSTKEEPGGRNKTKPESTGGFFSSIANFFTGQGATKPKEDKKNDSSKSTSSGGGGGFNESSLKAAMDKAGYTDQTERAMFLAQMAHESGNFKYDEEIHDGSNYEGRSDLGNTQPGDGVRYKGRGYIQLTGRANYRHYGEKLGVDLEGQPELAKRPDIAAAVAVGYWNERVNREAARQGDVRTVTKNINGGYNGLADREAKFKKYMGDPNYTAPGSGLVASSSSSSSGGLSPSSSSSSSSGGSSIAASLKTIRSHLGSSSGGQTAQLGKNTPSVSTPTPPVKSQPKVQTINSGSESGGQAESPSLLSSDTPFIPSPPASAEKMLVMGLPA